MTFVGWFVVFNKRIPPNVYRHFELFYRSNEKITLLGGLDVSGRAFIS